MSACGARARRFGGARAHAGGAARSASEFKKSGWRACQSAREPAGVFAATTAPAEILFQYKKLMKELSLSYIHYETLIFSP